MTGTAGGWGEDEQLAAAIVVSSPLAVVVIDLDRRVRLLNPAAEALLKRPADAFLGRDLVDLLPTATAEETLRWIEAATEGEAGHLEIEVRQAERDTVPVGISFAPLMVAGERRGAVGVGRDISDRKRLERELAELADGFQALSEASNLGVYRLVADPEVRFEHANRTFELGSGWSFEDLRRSHDGFAATLPRWLRRRIVSFRSRPEEAAWPIEFEWRQPDGRTSWLSLHEVALRDDEGRIQSVTGIIRDETHRRQRQAALADALRLERRAAAELRRIDDLRRLFLQATSHELRTPLTSVLGMATLLRDRLEDLGPDRAHLLAERVVEQATKLQQLLDDLLDVERLSRGVVQLRRETVDVAALVAAVVDEQGDGGIEVELPVADDTDGEVVLGQVDPAKIERILVNLLTNARKHGGVDAHVTVRLRRDTAVGTEVGLELTDPLAVPDDGHPRDLDVAPLQPGRPGLRIEVEDDGPGVPDRLKRRVFGLFEQGVTDATRRTPGTGIGLTLVAELTHLHGGTVWLEDAPDAGTRVVVWLPDCDPDAAATGGRGPDASV
jgi:PAS domain S-box-containing protein